MSTKTEEQQNGMTSMTPKTKILVNHVAVYVMIKVLMIFIFCLVSALVDNPGITIVTLVSVGVLQFLAIKNISGLHLVGLKWNLIKPNENGDYVEYYVRPSPFIPSTYQSNIFWIGFFLIIIFWICMAIFLLIFAKFSRALSAVINLTLEFINLYFFARAHNYAKQASENEIASKFFDGFADPAFTTNDPEKHSDEQSNIPAIEEFDANQDEENLELKPVKTE